MTDLTEVATIVLAVVGGKHVIEAPARAVGDVIHDRVKARLERLAGATRVKAEDRPIRVSERVAVKAFQEAAFTDDEVIVDYLAGVLAASSAEDDAGAAIVAQIGRLSARQLRFHYMCYRALHDDWPADLGIDLWSDSDTERFVQEIPIADVVPSLVTNSGDLAAIVTSLIREDLLGEEWGFGTKTSIDADRDTEVVKIRPTGPGAELFLWGHGVPDPHAARFAEHARSLTFEDGFPTAPGASWAFKPPPTYAKVRVE